MRISRSRRRFRSHSRQIVAFSLIALFVFAFFLVGGSASLAQRRGEREQRQELKSGKTSPKETKGAPYPAVKPSGRIPNEDEKFDPVPDGPKVGDMKPANPAIEVKEITSRDGKRLEPNRQPNHPQSLVLEKSERATPPPPPLFFKDYEELTNSISSTSGCCPEVSAGENSKTVMMTGNDWMALSEDGGGSFSNINPTTIFPEVDGGFCCDQVVVYVPKIDMFVWLLQYWKSGGKNRIRLAAQTTSEVRSSNGTSWTYWDFVSDTFDPNSSLDYNDIGFGNSSLWWTSQNGTGRVVVRIPLSEIAAKSTINFQFTGGTSAKWSHLTQNATNTVYWAGHINNSQMRVFSMKDGDGFYSWRTVNINSWPNGTNSTKCPDGTDWMAPFETQKHYVFGNALQGSNVWFAWLAAAGGNFPEPHVQMVKISPSSWTLQQQVQVWNPKIAFQDAYLSTNSQGELGMEIAFGSGGFYPSSSVGVWGDFVVYYPKLSTRCITRWGDYNHSRRAVNGSDWVAAGYVNVSNDKGNPIVIPHYIRFGR